MRLTDRELTTSSFRPGTRAAALPGGHRTGAPGKHIIGGTGKYRLIDEKVRYFVGPSIADIESSPVRRATLATLLSCPH